MGVERYKDKDRGKETVYCPRFLRLVESCLSVAALNTKGGIVTYPFKTLVETVTRGSTSGLDVPSSLTERVETELVGDLGGIHGVGQILMVSLGARRSEV